MNLKIFRISQKRYALKFNLKWWVFRLRLKRHLEFLYQSTDPWDLEKDITAIVSELSSFLKAKQFKHILDIGGGEGAFLPLLHSHAPFVECVEISKKAIRKAKQKSATTLFFQSNIQDFELGNNKYDLILMSFVVDYLGFDRFPERFAFLLLRISKALVMEGFFIIVNPLYREEDIKKYKKMEVMLQNFKLQSLQKKVIQGEEYKIIVWVLTKPG